MDMDPSPGPSAMPAAHTEMHGTHGSIGGHVLPGSMFIIMALWWMLSVLQSLAVGKGKRKSSARFRGWCTFWPAPWLPLEPALKVALPFIGILGELYFSHHNHWRTLYTDDGHLWGDHLNNWQHSTMYFAFMLSGAVDLLGIKLSLPTGTEQVFLALAFAVEGLLLAFHIKGSALDRTTHLLLVITVALCVVAILAEVAFPNALLLSVTRCWAVLLQGTWWCQAGRVLFLGNPAWDEDAMSSAMYLPVVFVLHLMLNAAALLVAYAVVQSRLRARGSAGEAKYIEMESGSRRGSSTTGTARD